MRTLGAGQARDDGREIELERVAEHRLGRGVAAEQALLLAVALDELDRSLAAARAPQVTERLGVDREETAGGAVLGRHVGDRRPVGEAHLREARAVELHELLDHALLAQHLRHGQHEVGRGRALAQLPDQAEADHLRRHHVERLAEHRGLGLDAADAPAEDAQAVDHRGVRVGADQRVGQCQGLAVPALQQHAVRQELQVHLVHDARGGRDHTEVVEGLLAPAQELVALAVSLELERGVSLERVLRAEGVHLDRVVDDEVDRHERVDARGVVPQALHRGAHRGEVHDGGHAGEVLQNHARRQERHLDGERCRRVPPREARQVIERHQLAVHVAQHRLEQDLDRERQPREPGREPLLLERLQAVDDGFAGRGLEARAGEGRIGSHRLALLAGWAVARRELLRGTAAKLTPAGRGDETARLLAS